MRVSKYLKITLLTLLSLTLLGSIAAPTMAAAPTATAAQATQPTAVIATGALNVRTGPGIGYNAIAVVYQGTTVTLLSRNANSSWVKIQLGNNVQGWVNASLISASVAISSLPTENAPTLTAVGVVATGALNIRSGPDIAYPATAVVYQGYTLTLIGRNANSSWVKVRLSNSAEGWANASLLTTNVTISSLPTSSAPAAPTIPTGTVTASYLNMRSGPDVSFGRTTTLGYGESVALIGRNANSTWANIRLSTGHEGWVNATYLTTNVAISSLPLTTAGTPTIIPTATIATSYLNVRSGPGVGYGITTALAAGQTAGLIGRNADGSWVHLLLASGVSGWVNASYITANVAISSLPVQATTTSTTAPAVIATGAANVRYGPDISYGSFAIAYQGTNITLLGRNSSSTWVKIALPGGAEGWINASLITTSVNIGSLPQLW